MSEDAHGAVDGYVYASRHRARAAYQWSVDVTAYVREDARGRSVGKRLYTRLFEELPKRGCYQAFAGIALPNAASVALHASVGFEHLGIYRDVGFKLDAWHDVGWWQRSLQPPSPRRNRCVSSRSGSASHAFGSSPVGRSFTYWTLNVMASA